MARLGEFRPTTGAVWRSTTNRLSRIHLELYCDDSKGRRDRPAEPRRDFDVSTTRGPRGRDVDMLVLEVPCRPLGETVPLCLSILDFDDLRGALRPDTQGRTDRGSPPALQALLAP